MKIRLIWVGKTKEAFVQAGIHKYLRYLKPYSRISVTEIREEKGKDIEKIKEQEGERIIRLKAPFYLLDERGEKMTSEDFARFLENQGASLNFVIGGAYGVSDKVKETAAGSLSLSAMTHTHEMIRVIFLEQLYRAFTIIHKRSYHH